MKTKTTIIGMLLLVTAINAQTKVLFGGSANYFASTNAQKNNTGPMLFTKNAQSFSADFTVITKKSRVAFKLSAAYVTGTNDNDAPIKYAAENNIEFNTYSFSKSNPGGFLVTAGPRFTLFPKAKKLPFMWLDITGGAFFNNQQTLQYFFNGQTVASTELKSNAVSFVYNPTVTVNIIKTSKMFVNLKAGYSNVGGFGIGLGITERDCTGAPCWKCNGAYCTPSIDDSNSNQEK